MATLHPIPRRPLAGALHARAPWAGSMSGRFVVAVVGSAAVDLALHAACYALVLADFFDAHPAGSAAFVEQLQRDGSELIVWSLAVSALTMGAFVTTVMSWSGVHTFRAGLRRGVVLGLLFWTAVNAGLYASSHVFSLAGAALDTPCSATCMAVAAATAAAILRPGAGGDGQPTRR